MYVVDRLDQLIAKGEAILARYNRRGNIDEHDLWITEAKNFLAVSAPNYVEKLHAVGPKYSEALLAEPFGRAAYNCIQEQLEVLRLARGEFREGHPTPSNVTTGKPSEDILIVKPTLWGITLNVNALWRRLRDWWQSRKHT